MCLGVFVAADEPLPLIAFDAAAPAFNSSDIWPQAEPVRASFTKPHVYSLGAHTGCGCGFRYSSGDHDLAVLRMPDVPEDVKEDVRADYAARQEAVRQLKQHLAKAIGCSGAAEVFACWAGDEAAQPLLQRNVTLDHFGGEEFCFVEKELLIVLVSRTQSVR